MTACLKFVALHPNPLSDFEKAPRIIIAEFLASILQCFAPDSSKTCDNCPVEGEAGDFEKINLRNEAKENGLLGAAGAFMGRPSYRRLTSAG